MISGIISLYDRSGEIVDTKRYTDKYERKRAIDKWKTKYGQRYYLCFIQIAPDTSLFPLTNKDGTNKKHN